MKALAVFPAERDVRLIDHEEPSLTHPTQVKIRLREIGVCGTDREIVSFEYGTPPAGSPYLVIGHESLAEVIEVGSGVTHVKVGDVVVPMVRRPCAHDWCLACREGRQDFCYSGDFTERGIKQAHGFMTEYVVDDERYMNVVPPALRDVGVLVEPLTIAEKGLAQLWQIQERLPWACAGAGKASCHRAVVLGAGPVGMLGAMALVAAGFETTVYSRSPAPNPRATLLASIGARYVSSEEVSVQGLAEQVGNIDVVYEAVGASRVAFDVITVLGTNGVFIFTGVPGRKAPIEVDTDLVMRNLVLKNQILLGTVNAGQEMFEAAIRDLAVFDRRWPQALRGLITARLPLAAWREPIVGRRGAIKDVLTIG